MILIANILSFVSTAVLIYSMFVKSKENMKVIRRKQRNMKKFIMLLISALLLLTGCTSAPTGVDKNTLKVICTTFPVYDWVREITTGTDNIELSILLDNGVDLHNYQPSANDIINITNSDVFVYIGGESDDWVDDVFSTAPMSTTTKINLLEVLGEEAKIEEVVEGMEAEEEADPAYDEHIWLSLKNANKLSNHLTEVLSTMDADESHVIGDNYVAYGAKLLALDKEYEEVVSSAATKTVLFGDRFPFRYMADDYGLTYYAAFAGCSAETEASFETLAFLSEKVKELNLKYVLTLEGSDHSIAETIANGEREILSMNSMQSTTTKSNETYLSIMESNLEVLSKALS